MTVESTQLLASQKKVLEWIAKNYPLAEILNLLAVTAEEQEPGGVASICLLEEGRLRFAAAPSLPAAYNKLIDGIAIGAHIGTCCSAAARNETVITPDIDTSTGWEGLKQHPLALGLKAAWSQPIVGQDGRVLGTFGTYFNTCREPTVRERQTIEMLAQTAGLAIEHHERERALQQSRESLARLNANLEQQVLARSEELRKKEEQLHQAAKLEALGRLAGGVAHDFNNLMTGILGATEDFQQSLSADDPRRGELEEVIRATRRVFDLTRGLMAFGRRQIARTQSLDLNMVFEQTRNLLSRLVGEHISLQFDVKPVPPISIDPSQLEQIIVNLVINARDAMPEGGIVWIRTAVSNESSKPWVRLEISDTGCGMSPEVIPHIFEPFFTTKERDQGTGLGLSTVYGIVEQSGGRIDVESAVGKGSTFRLYFPSVIPVADPATEASQVPTPKGRERILVVEDEDIVRRVVVRKLRHMGYVVVEARNGREALALSTDPPFDLVISDVVMPEMHGREVVARLRERYPEMRSLFISGYPEDIVAHGGVIDPGIDFLEKARLHDDLPSTVRSILDRPLLATR